MERFYADIASSQRSPEQALKVLHADRRDVTVNVLLDIIDGTLMVIVLTPIAVCSIRKFQGELNLTGASGCAVDEPEP